MWIGSRVKNLENHLEILGGGGCAGAKQVSDGAIALLSPALAPPLLVSNLTTWYFKLLVEPNLCWFELAASNFHFILPSANAVT